MNEEWDQESEPVRETRVGDAERERAVRVLGEHFAAGRIDETEHQERTDRAYAAKTRSELDALFEDLPYVAPGTGATAGVGEGGPTGRPGGNPRGGPGGWRGAWRGFGPGAGPSASGPGWGGPGAPGTPFGGVPVPALLIGGLVLLVIASHGFVLIPLLLLFLAFRSGWLGGRRRGWGPPPWVQAGWARGGPAWGGGPGGGPGGWPGSRGASQPSKWDS